MMQQNELFSVLPTPPVHDVGCKRAIRLPADTTSGAEFSPCKQYRLKLVQRWSMGPFILWCMMNPSIAGEQLGAQALSDATVAKTGRISRRLGFGGQMIGNACAYRATDRMRLLEVKDPVGPRNHAAILEMAAECKMVVIAHGRLPGSLQAHADAMCRLLLAAGHKLHVLRLTPDGCPMHPLARGKAHIPEDVEPMPWAGPGEERT